MPPVEGGLLFVDLSFRARQWDTMAGALRSLPPALIDDASMVLFRSPVTRWLGELDGVDLDSADRHVAGPAWQYSPDDLANVVDDLMRAHQLPLREVGVVELPVGADPLCSRDVTSAHLAWARAVELQALLSRNGGIWRPSTYHYVLPSGAHAPSFVRVADALRDPRAAEALATWLYPRLTGTTSVVVDSGTLMPIVQQLDLAVARASHRLPVSFGGLVSVEAIDEYPLSRFELLRRLDHQEATDVLALLSVSSTGRTWRLLGRSLDGTADSWAAECLVSRDAQASEVAPVAMGGVSQPWLQIEELESFASRDRCTMCSSTAKPQAVHIDPRSFAAMVLPEPTLVMADTFAARRNSSIFEAYRRSGEPRFPVVQLAGTERSRNRANPYHRPDDPRRVRFEPTSLLGRDPARLVTDRLAELKSLRRADPSQPFITKALDKLAASRPTVAIVDAEEVRVLAASFDARGRRRGERWARARLLAAARATRRTVTRVVTADEDLVTALAADTCVLALAVGLHTGVTLQHMVFRLRDAFFEIGHDPEIVGLVVHAHPQSATVWSSVRNTFGGKSDPSLLALWLTYVRDESPFAVERDLFGVVEPDWMASVGPLTRQLYDERFAWLRTNQPDSATIPGPPSPLWSPRPVDLGRTSIFGLLDDRHALAAVGAALHEAMGRDHTKGAPRWVQVDLPNAFRSFFDALLHVSVLRWTTPSQAWWGPGNECVALLAEVKGRFTPESADWQLLLPELLLASALGKVPDDGVVWLLGEADEVLTDRRWDEQLLAYVELGQVLVENLWEPNVAPAETATR